MGKLDLNNAADFARATNSFGASVLANFTSRGPTDWIIDEAAYASGINPNNVSRFHIFETAANYDGAVSQISDAGGRRLSKFQFPYQDGQLTEDLGRKAEDFTIEVVIHGPGYLAAFNKMMEIMNEPVPGTLVHPVRGDITCKMETYEVTHQDSMRKAVSVRLTMTEHSFEALNISDTNEESSAPTLLAKLSQGFVKIDNAINAVQGVVLFAQSLKNQIKQNLQAYKDAYTRISGHMNSTFNSGNRIPALSPTQQGGVLNASGQVVTNSTSIAASPDDQQQTTPVSILSLQTQRAVAVDQLFKDINTTRAQLSATIQQMEDAGDGAGALLFFDNIVDLRQTANDMQDAFDAGKQTSQSNVAKFVTPHDMSVREVAFAIGLSPDEGIQIMYMNPELDSANLIPKGTTLQVAIT